ncbi:hypothetical protein THF5H11_20537 [Vibrio jasicida]|nr:hypothetical protein THF5H11_20537 [Vibrio jasicida]CAH1606698.1 hypothetical protein THF5G08_30150 [Vibrio jasicida]
MSTTFCFVVIGLPPNSNDLENSLAFTLDKVSILAFLLQLTSRAAFVDIIICRHHICD